MKRLLPRPTTRPIEEDPSLDGTPRSTLRWNRLLVAVDLTPECRAALLHAAELAQIHRVPLTLLHVVTAKVKRRAPCPVLTLAVPRKAKARRVAVKFVPEEAWRVHASGQARLRPRASTT